MQFQMSQQYYQSFHCKYICFPPSGSNLQIFHSLSKCQNLKSGAKLSTIFSMTTFRFSWVKFVTFNGYYFDIFSDLMVYAHKWLEGTIPLFELCVNVIFDGLISCKAVNYDYKIFPYSPSHAKFCGILVHCFNTFISHYRWDAKSTKFLGPITSRQQPWKVHTKSGQPPPSTPKYQRWRENRHFPK